MSIIVTRFPTTAFVCVEPHLLINEHKYEHENVKIQWKKRTTTNAFNDKKAAISINISTLYRSSNANVHLNGHKNLEVWVQFLAVRMIFILTLWNQTAGHHVSVAPVWWKSTFSLNNRYKVKQTDRRIKLSYH